jgi:predicted nucleic acid-binding protein
MKPSKKGISNWNGSHRSDLHKLQDKPQISFTDLTSMVAMSELDITNILTEDDHFMQMGMDFRTLP